MPTYKVRDNQTGKVVTFKWNGDAPPTDADMEQVFVASRAAAPPSAGPTLRLPSPSPPGIPLGETDPSALQQPPPKGLLPVAGSLFGTGAGMLAGPLPGYMGNVAGAMAGSAAEDYLYDVPKEEMAKRALESGILAGVAPIAGGAAERVAAPGLKSITSEARNALAYARANNLPIDVSEVSPSWITQLFSGDIFAAGRYKTRRYARDSNDYLVGLRSKILETLTGAPETTGVPISAIPGKAKPALRAKKAAAYEEPLKIVQEAFGDADAMVRLENTRRLAGEMLRDSRIQNAKKARYAPDSPKEFIEGLLRTSEKDGSLPFSSLHQVQSKINRVFYGATNEGGAPLLATLADDLVKWDAAVGQRINEAYNVARKAAKDEFLFDTVYGTLRAATEVDKQSGAEILNGVRLRAKLQSPLKKAGWKTPEKEILDKLGEEEGRKVLDDLYAISDYAQYTQGLRKKQGMDIFDAKALISGAGIPAVGGLKFGIAVPQGSSLAFTVMLTGPGRKGFLRNFLLKEGHPSLKLGTRLGVQYGGEQIKE